jgi:hypothetical protein
MTSFDFSTPDLELSPSPSLVAQFFPFALFLTHRRGGAVFVGLNPPENSSLMVSGASLRTLVNAMNVETGTEMPLFLASFASQLMLSCREKSDSLSECSEFKGNDFILLLAEDKTAENLARLYSEALSKLSLTDSNIKTLIFGTGPGSFTGLRLGSAFLNGLTLGRKRNIYQINCLSADAMQRVALKAGLPDVFRQGLDSAGLKDEYALPVTALEVVLSLLSVDLREKLESDFFEPRYGREPGPVLKLRSASHPPTKEII